MSWKGGKMKNAEKLKKNTEKMKIDPLRKKKLFWNTHTCGC